jgi:ectoine hydroxylase-related dioxygenase (phytanoyl-CoA dioxygenase family)
LAKTDLNEAFRLGDPDFAAKMLRHFRAQGYAVIRQVFAPNDLAELRAAFDRQYAAGMGHGRSFRHQNLFYRVAPDQKLGRLVRYVQWPSYVDPALNRYRQDRRMLAIVAPLLGQDLKQIINQLHWKPPGAATVDFAYHQDCRFRRPASAYRDLANSYAQTGIAVDAHTPENGAMKIVPGSHLRGDLGMGDESPVMSQAMNDESLRRVGIDPASLIDLRMEAGDVAMWSPFLIHGSGANRTAGERRLYINGYARAADCDRGEWAFRAGQPVPFGPEPAVVHYEDVHNRPEPHYVEETY